VFLKLSVSFGKLRNNYSLLLDIKSFLEDIIVIPLDVNNSNNNPGLT